MKHLFIVNPMAGGRKGKTNDITETIKAFTKTLHEPFEIYCTKEPMDACRKIQEEAGKLSTTGDLELYVYACGGDGTLNECINGAAGQSAVAVSQYPCGTGNDFLRMYAQGNTVDEFKDFAALSKGIVKPLDIIDCSISGNTNSEDHRYGLNICSVGIDARVGTDVHKYSSIPVIGGATGYTISLIINVIKGITQMLHITCTGIVSAEFTDGRNINGDSDIKEKIFDQKITLACACNGSYYGGGFNPVPDALPDDGILECLVVEPVSRLKVAGIVGKYAAGRFKEVPEKINYIRCTQMTAEAEKEFVVNIDGERLLAKKICFKLIPHGVNYLFPENTNNS